MSGGSCGDLVKAESMIQLALALPAGCLIGVAGRARGWTGTFTRTGSRSRGFCWGRWRGSSRSYRTAAK